MKRFQAATYKVTSVLALLWATPAFADNPIVQHLYTADPAPMVHGDTLYLYTSHDEDVTLDNFFTMNDWRLFSSKDAANWTDHGSPLSYQSFSWATGKAWAPHCVERNGKFYLYVPVSNSIGVAVSDTPYGPFKDAIGKPLLSNYQYIDPTVFVDGDGQAYLYFGNPKLWYVKLNADMISYSGSVQQIANTTQSFGTRSGDAARPTLYEEGPWFYRRNDLYYMAFAAGPLPEDISYSTSSGPTGPWTYRGIIMDSTSGLAFTNHAGLVDFKGHSLFFYHTQGLPGGGGYKRSVAVEEFTYGADGSIPKITPTKGAVAPMESLSPYFRVEGETMAWSSGIEVDGSSPTERYLSFIDSGDFVKVRGVDFKTGAVSFVASAASAAAQGGTIELHLDSQGGPTIATCDVPSTGGWTTFEEVSCDVSALDAQGEHDLFLVFKGGAGSLFNLDWWRFVPQDPLLAGTGGTSTGGSSSGVGASSGGTSSSSGGAPSSGGGFPQPPLADGLAGASPGAEGSASGPQGCSCDSVGLASRPSSHWSAAIVVLTLFYRVRRRRGFFGARL